MTAERLCGYFFRSFWISSYVWAVIDPRLP